MRMRMHGWWRAGEERKREARHMCTVPPRGSAVLAPVADGAAPPTFSFSSNSASYFCKDGRKISVGDCALFKSPQDTPPFIGIIRSVNSDRENKLKLIVNWLYRPSEVKLGKGFLLESAPNEIFYSFHKDEIPAAFILHPCKVAFLPKSVELPSGIGSFVCRRVYDITNKCLWWLTDQDYINEQQQEVDQLLYKTRLEMHATIPPGGRSPRPTNGPTSTSQLKSGSESVQNSHSFPSQGKGKKRERGDQGFESMKRERGSKMEDGEPGHSRTESNIKSELAKITEKGGLVDYEGVEKLVQLMLPERNEKNIDLVCRSILAGVVAATDKFDCLNRFVQLRGLPVFDDWLQQVHKGKIGDSSSPRDSDKSIEEFLLILLRALDKLPVNLHALQMCNIGKSVNHLRTHKNLDIQKKARSLVDTWKRRVEAEMDAKSGSNQGVSWPTRPRLPEVPQSANKQSGGTNEVAIKSVISQPAASKTSSVKLVQGETTMRSAFASPGSLKSAPLPASAVGNGKDGQHRNVAATDLLSASVKDEKSSSSSQSHNSSQSSSDHSKIGDARSSTAGSKTSAGSSRSRKSVNGFPGSTISVVQKETGSNRSSVVHRTPACERLSQSNLTCEKTHDLPVAEGSNHKLIVKIPNRARSPAQSASGGLLEDPSVTNSRSSSPVLSEKQDQSDNVVKEKSETFQANISANMYSGNDVKDALAVSGNGEGPPSVLVNGKGCKIGDDAKKVVEVAKAVSSSSGHEPKAARPHEASLSSINALIDSCVKYSETKVSMVAGDDIGMNLLASVAAGEISKPETVSPTNSPVANSDHCSDGIDSRAQSSAGADVSRVQCHSAVVDEGQGIDTISGKNMGSGQEKPATVLDGSPNVSPMDLQQTGDSRVENNQNSSKLVVASEETSDGAGENLEEKIGSKIDGISDIERKVDSSLLTQANMSGSGAVAGSLSCQTLETKVENKKNVSEGSNSSMQTDPKPPQSVKREDKDTLHSSDPGKDMAPGKIDEVKAEMGDGAYSSNHNESECKSMDPISMNTEDQVMPRPASNVASCKFEQLENIQEGDETKQLACVGTKAAPVSKLEETNQHARLNSTGSEGDRAEESNCGTVESSFSAARASKVEAKVKFDLNEDCDVEDGKLGELSSLKAPGSTGYVQKFISPLPFPVSSLSSSLPASVTVAAAAKGPFVPPEDLLRSKGALGWKGSAATSAFRPAEPRKVLEMPLGSSNVSLSDAATGKQSRPLLDIDLNVPDERVLEDFASRSSAQDTVSVSINTINRDVSRDELIGHTPARFSVLDLDLNRVEESTVNVNYPTSNSRRINASVQPVVSSSGALSHGEVNVHRDFDLNDGPVTDEVTTEPSIFNQPNRGIPFQPPVSGLRISNTESGNLSSWFPRANTYSTITVPSVLSDRGEQPFPVVTPVGPQRMPGGTPFGPDFYRAPVLSSSPAMPFPSTQFQYPVFPFGTSFPPTSATFSGGSTTYVDTSSGGRLCFPAVSSQFLGPAGAVPSHYPRPPYVVSLADGNNTANSDNSWKWGKQGLDLNAGPGVPEMEGRDENSPLVPRQLSVANSQALAEEQARMYHLAGGLLKRKEPEGGWDGYKRPSWQ